MSRFSTIFKKAEALPEHQVRISTRAKSVRLQINESGELTVVIPKGFSQRYIADVLHQRSDWIAKTRNELASLPPPQPITLPESLFIPATGKDWKLEYVQGKSMSVSVRQKGESTLRIQGNIAEQKACRLALQRWLIKHAHEILVPWLQDLSHVHGLVFQKTTVRTQRTRWASCSSRGTISINSQLLFLEKEQVDYVFLHELCHTKHMNHSTKFWALLEEIMPNYKKHHLEIQNQAKKIPRWVMKKS